MCEPATIAMAVGTAVAGAAAASAMSPSIPKVEPQNPEKPPQESKAPQAQGMRKNNGASGGINAGQASTFLTGAQGVDPGSLQLGRNVLLGL